MPLNSATQVIFLVGDRKSKRNKGKKTKKAKEKRERKSGNLHHSHASSLENVVTDAGSGFNMTTSEYDADNIVE